MSTATHVTQMPNKRLQPTLGDPRAAEARR
jgi:hypothetical protein